MVGSTLGCYSKGCTLRYHYLCAMEAGEWTAAAQATHTVCQRCARCRSLSSRLFPERRQLLPEVSEAQGEEGEVGVRFLLCPLVETARLSACNPAVTSLPLSPLSLPRASVQPSACTWSSRREAETNGDPEDMLEAESCEFTLQTGHGIGCCFACSCCWDLLCAVVSTF